MIIDYRRKLCFLDDSFEILGVIPGDSFRLCTMGKGEALGDQNGHLGRSDEKGCLTLEDISVSCPVNRKCLKPPFTLNKRHYILVKM